MSHRLQVFFLRNGTARWCTVKNPLSLLGVCTHTHNTPPSLFNHTFHHTVLVSHNNHTPSPEKKKHTHHTHPFTKVTDKRARWAERKK